MINMQQGQAMVPASSGEEKHEAWMDMDISIIYTYSGQYKIKEFLQQ